VSIVVSATGSEPVEEEPVEPAVPGPTAADLVAETRRHLDGSGRDVLNQLAGALSVSAEAVPLSREVGPVAAGDRLGVGLEVMYVWSFDPPTRRAVVRRGVDGSAAGTHALADLVRVNPRFTDWAIFGALNHEVSALHSEGLFAVRTVARTVDAERSGYDLTADLLGDQVLAVHYQDAYGSADHHWVEVGGWRVALNVPTAEFPSGRALILPTFGGQDGQPLRITYKAPLAPLTSLADDVAAKTGLAATALDIPPLGAAVRLMAGRPVQRADPLVQPQTRRAEEVSTSDVLNSPGALRALRATRVTDEKTRLAGLWPTRLVTRRLA
jgi:hypothetical protein